MTFLHYWDYKYIYKIYNKKPKLKNTNMYNKQTKTKKLK